MCKGERETQEDKAQGRRKKNIEYMDIFVAHRTHVKTVEQVCDVGDNVTWEKICKCKQSSWKYLKCN